MDLIRIPSSLCGMIWVLRRSWPAIPPPLAEAFPKSTAQTSIIAMWPNGWLRSEKDVSAPALTRRLLTVLWMLLLFELGAVLLFLPWLNIWDTNYFLSHYPVLRPLLLHPSLRGAI